MSNELIICGRKVGTYLGWDQADTFVMQVSDLVPGPGYAGPSDGGDVSFDFENGVVNSYDEDGDIVNSVDLIEALKDCPRAKQ